MKQLTCEMCGSTDLLKQDGIFVCQTCGMKYSAEEAKKMMIEGTVEVTGTVRVDHSEKLTNYLTMARNAYNASNNSEAEMYCNKIIEIDPNHSEAWFLKGSVAAWQSTGANIRMDEFMACTKRAFACCETPESLTSLARIAYKECYNLTLAIHDMKLKHVVSFPNAWDEFLPFHKKCLTWTMQLQLDYGFTFNQFYANAPENEKKKPITLEKDANLIDVYHKTRLDIHTAGVNLWNNSFKEYKASSDGNPGDYAFERMVKEGYVAIQMVKLLIPDDTSKIKEYEKPVIIKACENLINMRQAYMELKSYTISFTSGVTTHPVKKKMTLESKEESKKDIQKCHEIIKYCNPSYEIPTSKISEKDQKSAGVIAILIFVGIVVALGFGLAKLILG